MNAAQSPELQAKIAIWRQRALENTLTLEEMKEAIAALLQGRKAALASSDSARTRKAKTAIPAADDLLAELGSELGGDL